MSDRFTDNSPPNSKNITLLIFVLVLTTTIWVVVNFGIFDESEEEPLGMIVRFILFFKQSMLI